MSFLFCVVTPTPPFFRARSLTLSLYQLASTFHVMVIVHTPVSGLQKDTRYTRTLVASQFTRSPSPFFCSALLLLSGFDD